MPRTIYVRAGDTEPLTITLSATGLADLTGISSATFYAREVGVTTNHVDGATLSIPDANELDVVFDPAGNGPSGADAFGEGDEGTYRCYVLLAHSDGDETRHPGRDSETLTLVVAENFEA